MVTSCSSSSQLRPLPYQLSVPERRPHETLSQTKGASRIPTPNTGAKNHIVDDCDNSNFIRCRNPYHAVVPVFVTNPSPPKHAWVGNPKHKKSPTRAVLLRISLFKLPHQNSTICIQGQSLMITGIFFYFFKTSMPGRVPFSIYSSIAPPPVEICVIVSKYSFLSIAASVSPPPTILTRPLFCEIV